VTSPADNRRLVEHALHPNVLAEIAAELGTAWRNHAAECSGIAYADRQTGRTLALDLATPFRDLVFPDLSEEVATRLGAADLLVDFDPPLRGPFGADVTRLRIPHWLARGVGPNDAPEVLASDDDGACFRLGGRTYRYGQWVLGA
jgi:CRISPR-associated endonuclease/helicase Cas3